MHKTLSCWCSQEMLSRLRSASKLGRLILPTSYGKAVESKEFQTTAETLLRDSRGYTHFQQRGKLALFRRLQGRGPYVLGGTAVIGGVVYYSSLQEVPFTGRRHAIFVSVDMEKELGQQAYEEIKNDAQQQGTLLPAYHPYVQRVQRIARKIIASTQLEHGGGFQDHMKGLEWEIIVINRPDPNAMVVPGGKIVVHSGLLELMGSDDEVGAVLGHEAAHVLARHVAEKLTQTQLFEVFRLLFYWTLGIPIPAVAGPLAIFLPNSRKVETEADSIGVQLAAQACFDPSAAIKVFQKLGDYEKNTAVGSTPGFLRTHPLSETRVKTLTKQIPSARQTFELSHCGRRQMALSDAFW